MIETPSPVPIVRRGETVVDENGVVLARRGVEGGRRFEDVRIGEGIWQRSWVTDVVGEVPSAARYAQDLRRRGWREIGRGGWAIVFARPGGRTVLRLARKRDPWLRFAEIAQGDLLGNPHVPRIRSLEAHEDFAVARLERLDELERGTPAWAALETLLAGRATGELAAAMERLRAEPGVDSNIDWKNPNCMSRGGVLVIIDPFSAPVA